MSRWLPNDLHPHIDDTDTILLKKIARRLELNANVDVAVPSSNVAVTNTPLPVQFSATQPVSVQNVPSVNANVTNASIAVTSDDELEVIIHEHEKIHNGEAFLLSEVRSVGNGVTYLWMLSTPVAPTIVHLTGTVVGTVEYTFSMYEAPVAPVGGVAWTPVARNRHNSVPNVVTALTGLTVGGNGTLLYTHRQGSGQTSGGATRAETEFVLNHSTNYLFALTAHGAAGNFTLQLQWYLV